MRISNLKAQLARDLKYEDVEGKNLRQRLVFTSHEGPILLGFISKHYAGGFWWFVYNYDIHGASNASKQSLKVAKDSLKKHCLNELVRLYSMQIKGLAMDKKFVEEHYEERPSDKVFEDRLNMTSEQRKFFELGIAFAHTYSAMPRPPEWAKFVSQNAYSTLVYHEKKPEYEEVWHSGGKCKQLALPGNAKDSLIRLPRLKEK